MPIYKSPRKVLPLALTMRSDEKKLPTQYTRQKQMIDIPTYTPQVEQGNRAQ